MMSWEELRAAEDRFRRWDAHWTLIYDRLYQAGLVLGAMTVFAPLFGAHRVGYAALCTQVLTFLVWRIVAQHRFRGHDRWLEWLRKQAGG